MAEIFPVDKQACSLAAALAAGGQPYTRRPPWHTVKLHQHVAMVSEDKWHREKWGSSAAAGPCRCRPVATESEAGRAFAARGGGTKRTRSAVQAFRRRVSRMHSLLASFLARREHVAAHFIVSVQHPAGPPGACRQWIARFSFTPLHSSPLHHPAK